MAIGDRQSPRLLGLPGLTSEEGALELVGVENPKAVASGDDEAAVVLVEGD